MVPPFRDRLQRSAEVRWPGWSRRKSVPVSGRSLQATSTESHARRVPISGGSVAVENFPQLLARGKGVMIRCSAGVGGGTGEVGSGIGCLAVLKIGNKSIGYLFDAFLHEFDGSQVGLFGKFQFREKLPKGRNGNLPRFWDSGILEPAYRHV